MKTKTQTVYLYAVLYKEDSKPSFSITTTNDMQSLPEYTYIGEKEITFDLPEVNTVTPAIVKGLEETRDTMRAAANAAIMEVENQIASMLALEHINEDA